MFEIGCPHLTLVQRVGRTREVVHSRVVFFRLKHNSAPRGRTAIVRRMAKIVTYAFRRRRQPKKKKAIAIAAPIVQAPGKSERIRRREEAAQDREVSPEEEAKVADLVRRMMRPRDE